MLIYHYRGHPKIKNLDMMHAADYSNMRLNQMQRKLSDAKQKDADVAKKMEFFHALFFVEFHLSIYMIVFC